MVENHYRWDFIGLSSQAKPTPETSEKVVNGSTFYEGDTSKLYVFCEGTWYEKTSSGGGGGTSDFNQLTNRPKYNGTAMTSETNIPLAPTVSQTTGTSETDVMSQNAVTSMVFASPSDKTNIQIGAGAQSTGIRSISIFNDASASSSWGISSGVGTINLGAKAAAGGRGVAIGEGTEVTTASTFGIALGAKATASGAGAVALGSYSNATSKGEMNIGSSNTYYGYNSSNYRLISGVYDGQSDHDAATVGQIKMGILSAAPTGATAGMPGRLYSFDNGGTYEIYLCVHDNGDNTYVWKQLSLI